MLQLVAAKPRYLGWLYKESSTGDWIAFFGAEERAIFKYRSADLNEVIDETEKYLGRRMKLQPMMNANLGYRIY